MPGSKGGELQWLPADYFHPHDPAEVFGRMAPLEVDFGCGEGAFLLAAAARHPERNFLGTERLTKRVKLVCHMAWEKKLTNLRLLEIESAYAVKHLFPAGSIAVAHVSFPDPWPKRHHQPRRLVQESFLHSVHRALEPRGEIRLKTDDLPYFRWMESVIARVPGFEQLPWPDELTPDLTNFERKFLGQGLPIHRVRLRKV